MKKILLFSILAVVVFAACNKKKSDPSITVTVSYPVISFPNGTYFSVAVGGTAPTPGATATDTVLHEAATVTYDVINVNTAVPGLYQATAIAANKYGFTDSINYYVAVTNLPSGNLNLPGVYHLLSPTDSFANTVTSIGNNYYSMSNFGGANAYTGALTPAVFAVITDSTIAFTDANFGTSGTIGYAPSDTTINYSGLSYYKL